MKYSFRLEMRGLTLGYVAVFLAAVVIQFNPGWRNALVYDRPAVLAGEFWRMWTGHLVHFGWPHLVADGGLLLILGWPLGLKHPVFSRFALLLLPPFICGVLLWFDPTLTRYAGLSAVNLGMLLYLAAQGWQKNWTDWFWPAVLVIYVAEVVFEIVRGGQGGGMIQFDDPTVKVATSAHLAAAAYGLLAWLAGRFIRGKESN
ncbi:MAG: rhombosortase [Lacunisphaera sp.]|nr:rhombosortase [Lacunisphaera sp.]